MNPKTSQDIILAPGNQDLLWELFQENSKSSRYDNSLSDEAVLTRMNELQESLVFTGYPIVELPGSLASLSTSLEEIVRDRRSVRSLTPGPISLENLATLLHYAYGETRNDRDKGYPRPFRVVPSAGALYPLELFFYTAHVEGLETGIYHYNPAAKHLRLLNQSEQIHKIAGSMVQPEVAHGTSLILFITAIFERSIFKYGDRGYRFILLEAGHVAQNLNLVATALGLGSTNIGGYFDREIDGLLGLDGVTHSTIYMVAVGKCSENP